MSPESRGKSTMSKRIFLSLALLASLGLVACGDDGTPPVTDSGTDDSAMGDGGTDCPTGQTECDGTCVDTDSDGMNCGACGTVCGAGEVCDGAGTCAVSCGTGLTDCSGSCIDTANNPAHCGGCGMACGAGEACLESMCATIDSCDTPSDPGAAGVTLSAPSGAAVEGGAPATYTVVLDSQPCTYVAVSVAGDAQIDGEPLTFVFTPDNWDTAQTVSGVAVHDFDIEGDHTGVLAHTATSGDTSYAGITIADVTVDIEDRAHVAHVSVSMGGAGANSNSLRPKISNDGRQVAFVSNASDLVPDDTGATTDVFLRDMMMGTTQRINEIPGGGQADSGAAYVQLSADGSVVAFASDATDLVTDTTSGGREVYYWNATDGVALASTFCSGCNQEMSAAFSISADGAFIAYSTRRAMVAADTDSEYDIYTLTLADGTLTHDSLNTADENGTFYWGSNAFTPHLSSTGRYLGFNSAARNLDTPDITVQNFHAYSKDRTDRTLTRTSFNDGGTDNCDGTHHVSNSSAPFISTDGSISVFSSACAFTLDSGAPADTNGFTDIFVRDIAATTTTRISLAHDGAESDADSTVVSISSDARYVLFRSAATNIVMNDTNGEQDLFVHDRMTSATIRVSYDAVYGELTGAVSDVAGFSPNGNFVVFATSDRILSTDDNDSTDVYAVRLR